MSTFSTPTTTTTDRPTVATTATVVLLLGALLDFAHIGAYMSGADIPVGILVLKVALGVAALAAAVGIWGRQRWAITLALGVAGLNLLLSAWGLAESLAMSGSTAERVVTGLGVLVSLAVIALVAPLAGRRTVA